MANIAALIQSRRMANFQQMSARQAPGPLDGVSAVPYAHQVAVAGLGQVPQVLEGTGLAPAEIQGPKMTKAGVPDQRIRNYTRNKAGDIVTESSKGQGVRRNPGMLQGAAKGIVKVPTVSRGVADLMDRYKDVDEIQNQIAMLRKTATLYARGYNKSNQLQVITPPDWQGEARKMGLGASQSEIAHSVGTAFDARNTNSNMVFTADGGYKGTTGDPQAAYRKIEAMAQPRNAPGSFVESMPVTSTAQGGAHSAGFTASELITLPQTLYRESVGYAEGVGNNEGGGAQPPEPPQVVRGGDGGSSAGGGYGFSRTRKSIFKSE